MTLHVNYPSHRTLTSHLIELYFSQDYQHRKDSLKSEANVQQGVGHSVNWTLALVS